MLQEAQKCLDAFSEAFNSENLKGMDDACHFPHTLISGSEQIIWPESGQLPNNFFNQLKATGWNSTTCEKCEPVLISANKIHLRTSRLPWRCNYYS